jgi:hypothetical protein
MKENWFGTVTNNNIVDIAQEILKRLSGKSYTWVECYEYRRFVPETRIHQHLVSGTNGSPLSIWFSDDGSYSGANFCDTYGVWGISPDMYISFERNTITIELITPAKMKATWQITVE